MDTTRRWVLARAVQLAGGILVLCRPWRAVAQRGTTWTTRRATPQDVGALVAIFNAHRAAGICPYADQMPLWTPAKAQAFLTVYTGTLIVERDGVPVGFGGLIDYSDPATSSSIAPDAEPEITVVAVDFERLAPREVVPAVQHLAAAMARGGDFTTADAAAWWTTGVGQLPGRDRRSASAQQCAPGRPRGEGHRCRGL